MAAPSGQPASNGKKELTPDQKRTYGLLGFAGVLALIAGAIYLPGMLGGSQPTETAQVPVSSPATDTAASPNTAPPTDPGMAPGNVPISPPAAAGIAPAGTMVNYIPVSKSRDDPFTPFIVNPLPPESSSDTRPWNINLPEIPDNDDEPVNPVPSLVLPPVDIPRMTTEIKAPRSGDINPPSRGSGTGAGGGEPQPSYDKRLSGIVIANGVRALLEISSGGELKNYVVQPGDTVEGITVLNIQRYNEGTTTITRMLIRENGQERYVDLKPAPQRAATGAEGGAPFGN